MSQLTTNIESGVQMYSRIRENECATVLRYPLFPDGVHTKECIEIVGDRCPADALVLDFVVRSILPGEYGGNETHAVLVNTEHGLTMPVIVSALQRATRDRQIDKKLLLETCLERLTLLNCYGSGQMRFTFMQLERLLQENERIKVVVVDSMCTYYWMDRPDSHPISFQKYCTDTANSLFDVVKDLSVALIYKSINNELTSKGKGLKRNYILNVLHVIEDKYKVQVIEDDVCKEQVELRIKAHIIYN